MGHQGIMSWHLCRKLSDRERNCIFKKALPSEDASKTKTQGTYGSAPVSPNKEVATLIEQLDAWLGESEALENLTPQESQVTDWKKKFQSVTGTLAFDEPHKSSLRIACWGKRS